MTEIYLSIVSGFKSNISPSQWFFIIISNPNKLTDDSTWEYAEEKKANLDLSSWYNLDFSKVSLSKLSFSSTGISSVVL